MLISKDEDGAGFHVGHPVNEGRGEANQRSVGRSRTLHLTRERDATRINDARVYECSVSSLMRLRTAECIDLGMPAGNRTEFRVTLLRLLHILPLGRDLLGVLKDERATADIEASAEHPR
jgi:hypothetical protein